MPRVVFYKLPSESFGEDVMVLEVPHGECEVALLLSKDELGLPLFDVEATSVHVSAVKSEGELFFSRYTDGFEATIPARNQNEAYDWARRFYERLEAFDNREES